MHNNWRVLSFVVICKIRINGYFCTFNRVWQWRPPTGTFSKSVQLIRTRATTVSLELKSLNEFSTLANLIFKILRNVFQSHCQLSSKHCVCNVNVNSLCFSRSLSFYLFSDSHKIVVEISIIRNCTNYPNGIWFSFSSSIRYIQISKFNIIVVFFQ